MIEDKPFNISLSFLESLLEIGKQIFQFQVQRNFDAWFRSCYGFYNMANITLDEEECKDCLEKLEEIKRLLNVPTNTKEGMMLARVKVPVIEDKLNVLTQRLWGYLNNHEKIFTKSQYKTWQDEIEADFS